MFLGDQGRDALIIKRIALLQNFPAIGPPSSIGGVFLGPFYYYLMAPFLLLGRLNPVSLAIGIAILSSLGMYIAYVIAKKTISKEVALYFFIICTFSIELVSTARYSWNPNLLPYFSFITLYFFVRSMELKNKKRFIYTSLFGLFFGLSFQLHHLAGLLALPIAALFIIELIRQRNIKLLLVPLISFGVFAFTLIPIAIFEFRHQFLNTKNLISVFTDQDIVSSGPFYLRMFDINNMFIGFAFRKSFLPGIALAITIATLLMSSWKCSKKYNAFVMINILAVVLYLFGFSRVNSALIPHYYNSIYLSFYFLLAYIFAPKKISLSGILAYLGLGAFIVWQSMGFWFFAANGSFQDAQPRKIGAFIAQKIGHNKINLTTYPTDFTSRDCYQYFIELNGGKVVNGSSAEVTDTLYVLCDKQPCKVINSDSWNIQMFGKAKIDTMWNKDGIYIYKLIHQ
jgi:4-amino-4-deoxy-L-arabinose transferase-like glycosyltransferase